MKDLIHFSIMSLLMIAIPVTIFGSAIWAEKCEKLKKSTVKCRKNNKNLRY